MSTINLDSLSKKQKLELMKQLKAEEQAMQKKIKDDREAYKKIVNKTIIDVFAELHDLSSRIRLVKEATYDSFADIIEMKADVYGEDINDQYSHTFTTTDSKLRIKLGHNITEDYDDTVNVGIEKVKRYITSLGRDENSKRLVNAVMSLLTRNKEGKLHTSRVIQLSKMAEDSGNKDFIDAVKIIRDAYRPLRSKNYVQAWYRTEVTQEWVALPLSITEA